MCLPAFILQHSVNRETRSEGERERKKQGEEQWMHNAIIGRPEREEMSEMATQGGRGGVSADQEIFICAGLIIPGDVQRFVKTAEIGEGLVRICLISQERSVFHYPPRFESPDRLGIVYLLCAKRLGVYVSVSREDRGEQCNLKSKSGCECCTNVIGTSSSSSPHPAPMIAVPAPLISRQYRYDI